jgi:hypothetical protein
MARKCSSCGHNGHNSRTCSGHGRVSETGGGGGGVRLFGVQLHVGPSSSPMKKCFSMDCLSSAAPPAYYAAALAASSSSPSVSSSSSLVSVEETAEKVNNGYLSDGLMGRAQERKKGEFVHNPEFYFFSWSMDSDFCFRIHNFVVAVSIINSHQSINKTLQLYTVECKFFSLLELSH